MTSPEERRARAFLRGLKDPVLQTPRLTFLLPNPGRVAEVAGLLNDRSVARWTLHIPYPYRTSDARAWLRRAPQARRDGTALSLHLVRRTDRSLVGGIGLHWIEPAHRRAEIGYWIGRPFRRQGYASEAVRALRTFGFRRLGLHRIEAHVFPGNRGSVGVLRSAGFRREGRLRDGVVKDGAYRDELLFASLDGDRLAPRERSPSRGARAGSAPTR